MSEICFKVGDSGGSKDGDVLAIMPDGWLISAVDMAAWLDKGTEPAVLAEMPKYMADRLRRRVLAVRWKLAHTAEEVEKEYGLPAGAGEHEKEEGDADAAKFAANGLDTNWGTLDLQHHAVVRVPDLTGHEIAEFSDPERTVDHRGKPLAKKRYRVAYETALSPVKIAAIRDREVRVPVDRAAALAKSVVVAKAEAGTKVG